MPSAPTREAMSRRGWELPRQRNAEVLTTGSWLHRRSGDQRPSSHRGPAAGLSDLVIARTGVCSGSPRSRPGCLAEEPGDAQHRRRTCECTPHWDIETTTSRGRNFRTGDSPARHASDGERAQRLHRDRGAAADGEQPGSCSRSSASDPSWPRPCCAPGPTRAVSTPRRRSRCSPAWHPSRPTVARSPPAIGSTDTATASSTTHCTPWSRAASSISKSTRDYVARRTAQGKTPREINTAASPATSRATSIAYSKAEATTGRRQHRSVASALGYAFLVGSRGAALRALSNSDKCDDPRDPGPLSSLQRPEQCAKCPVCEARMAFALRA